jgi:hypothetical protein
LVPAETFLGSIRSSERLQALELFSDLPRTPLDGSPIIGKVLMKIMKLIHFSFTVTFFSSSFLLIDILDDFSENRQLALQGLEPILKIQAPQLDISTLIQNHLRTDCIRKQKETGAEAPAYYFASTGTVPLP